LSNVDFPAFGFPTIAIWYNSPSVGTSGVIWILISSASETIASCKESTLCSLSALIHTTIESHNV
jgi:hypothetical protein